ncbi:DNA topoisomerase III [Novimethylophilus kurashikiensis]|uniref:DNA topoisomerase n=1 Tax=Novimethylophilus kurashikiensis TaxID=1825523 RepID=A0A2R5FCI4_9PROT|nr:DNA topoisomerase 3 [Novimethylophilus kurashikiensis]GBG14354.1 DNA topoisomerase III [Novimethylophilus kurashikiensis]
MSKSTLIIAEKPSVAKALAAWLADTFGLTVRSAGSHIVVGHYNVSWLFGHVLENIEPHEYDARFKAWSFDHLPIIPEKWQLKPRVDRETGKPDSGKMAQIKALKSLLDSATEVIGLGDPDQEGQLLQDEFLIWAGCKVPVNRLWLSAVDDATIAKAWKDIKPNEHYKGYYWMALARSHADWLYGINGTRACTLSSQMNGGNATLTLGRVQTPTLALIVFREWEIRHFKPVNYFTPFIHLATTPQFRAAWYPDKEDSRLDSEGRLLDRKVADGIVSACKAAATATVKDVQSDKGRENPPLPFSLSSLQEHLSRRYGIGVQDTLKYAQSLYEKKIATYPRTDCEYLPVSQHAEASDIVRSIDSASSRLPAIGGAAGKANTTLKSRAFNDKNVTAHHAIVPRPVTTSQLVGLSSQELLVWTEIAKRYLLQFFPAAEFLTTEILLECAKEAFKVTGKVYTSRGWKDAFTSPDDKEEEEAAGSVTLPKVAKGDVLKVKDAGFDSTTTKPPKRFTEGTLVAAMKSVHKFVTDPKLKAILRENVGIGTEATRANVIGELFGRKFITLEKKEIKPTELGEQLIQVLPKQISAPDMTALWQQAMDDIRKVGEKGYLDFIAAQKKWLTELVKEVPVWFAGKSMMAAGKKSGLTIEASAQKCTKCGSALNRVKGKFGWFFGCTNAACKTTFKDVDGKPVEKAALPKDPVIIGGYESGAVCPKCKKGELQLRVCGPASKAPGRQFLSCSNYFAKGKAKCEHSIWPDTK